MLDIGWQELFVVAAVALVVVGPKDLPKVMHTCGVWIGKLRRAMLTVQHDIERLATEAEKQDKKQEEKQEAQKDAPGE